MSVLDEVFGRGSRERIARLLKVNEVFTRQALSDGFVLGVRIGSIVRTCQVMAAELLRSQSQFGGPTGFLAGLLNDLARACIEQIKLESRQSRMYTLGSDEPEFIAIAPSVDMGMYETLVDDIIQGVAAQFAVPVALLGDSTRVVVDAETYLPDSDEPRKNRFERIAEEMLMDEEP